MFVPFRFMVWIEARVGSTSGHALHDDPTATSNAFLVTPTDVVRWISPSEVGATLPCRTDAIFDGTPVKAQRFTGILQTLY